MDQVHRLLLQVVRHGLVRGDHVAGGDVLVDEKLVVRRHDVHVVVFDPLLVVVGGHHQGVAVREDQFLDLFLAHHLHLLFVGVGDFPDALLLRLILQEVSLGIATFSVIGSADRSLLLNATGGSGVRLDAPIFEERGLVGVDCVIIVGVKHASTVSGVVGPVLLLGIVLRGHGLLEIDLLESIVDVVEVLLLELSVQLGGVRSSWLRSLNLARVVPVAKRLSVRDSRNIFGCWSDSLAIRYLLLGLLLVQVHVVLVDEQQWLLALLFGLLLRGIRGRDHLAYAQLLLVLDLLYSLDIHVAIGLVLVILCPASG